MLLLVAALAAALLGCEASEHEPEIGLSNQGTKTIVTLHASARTMTPLPFVVLPAAAGGEVYRNPVFGIEILGVCADGKEIHPEEFAVLFEPDTSKLQVSADVFVYRVETFEFWEDPALEKNHWLGVFAGKLTQDDYDLQRYVVPRKSSEVEIKYRVRRAYSGVGPVMTLKLLGDSREKHQ